MAGLFARFFVIAFAGGFALAGGNESGLYMKRAGPTLLRFKEPGVKVEPARLLPVLIMSNQVPSIPEITGPPVPLLNSDELFGPDWTPMESQDDATGGMIDPAPSQRQAPAQSAMTPQALLRYFNSSANREVLVPMPFDFTPPAPPASAPGSSAVYLSPPTP